jgi:hypothetical protein
VHYEDILTPNHVEIATLINADPPLLPVDAHQYMARCDEHGVPLRSQIPQDKWIFGIEDLLTLVASDGHPPATMQAQQSTEAGQQRAKTADGADWRAKTRELAQQIGETWWARGERNITVRRISVRVADEMAKESYKVYWGLQGPRSWNNIRNEALNGWKFTPPVEVA